MVIDEHRLWKVELHLPQEYRALWSPATLTIQDAFVGLPEGVSLTVAGDLAITSTKAPLFAGATVPAALVMRAAPTAERYGAQLVAGGDFTLASECRFYPHAAPTNGAIVGLRVAGDATIYGVIDADAKGYYAMEGNTNGPGAGWSSAHGGSYGGSGGGYSLYGRLYGIPELPLEAGSPGGYRYDAKAVNYGQVAGTGGGLIHLLVGGKLLLEGELTANGGAGDYKHGAGGSGGGILVAARRIEGSGTITADGAPGEDEAYAAPGSGGRISLIYGLPLREVELAIDNASAADLTRVSHYAHFSEAQLSVVQGVPNGTNRPILAEPGTAGIYTRQNTIIILR